MPKRFRTPVLEAPGAELEVGERRAREIIEGLRDAFVSLDAEWRVTDCNAPAERILDHPRAELVGRTVWEVIGVAPDSPLGELARRVRATGQPEEGEVNLAL